MNIAQVSVSEIKRLPRDQFLILASKGYPEVVVDIPELQDRPISPPAVNSWLNDPSLETRRILFCRPAQDRIHILRLE